MTTAVQSIDLTTTEDEARGAFDFLATQVDFLGGRVLAPNGVRRRWMVQAFFSDCGHDLPLPDGCRRVVILDSQRKAMGLRAA